MTQLKSPFLEKIDLNESAKAKNHNDSSSTFLRVIGTAEHFCKKIFSI